MLPSADSHSYYATFPAFQDEMNKLSKRLLAMAQGIVEKASPSNPSSLSSYDPAVDDPIGRFEDDILDHLDELYEQVVRSSLSILADVYLSWCLLRPRWDD